MSHRKISAVFLPLLAPIHLLRTIHNPDQYWQSSDRHHYNTNRVVRPRFLFLLYTEFRHIPACGWLKESPLHFTPSYADSTHRYNISLAVRHDSEFTFSNLSMTIDIFGNDSIIERKRVNLNLADSAGNWLGSGFGALYQLQAPLRAGTRAGEVTKIVVWQSLDTDTLSHLTEVGIILK